MNEKEEIVPEKKIERDGDLFIYEGKPFSGTSVGYSNDSEDISDEASVDKALISFKFTSYIKGKKVSEKHWKNGVDIGPQIQWYESGKKVSGVKFCTHWELRMLKILN